MSLLKTIHTLLSECDAITALVDDRIYRTSRPTPDEAYPFIVYSRAETAPRVAPIYAPATTTVTIECIGDAQTQDDLEVLREELKTLLAGRCGQLTEDFRGKVVYVNEYDRQDDDLHQSVRGITFQFLAF